MFCLIKMSTNGRVTLELIMIIIIKQFFDRFENTYEMKLSIIYYFFIIKKSMYFLVFSL